LTESKYAFTPLRIWMPSCAAAPVSATDWPSTNFDQSANRYSPLTQITANNVGTLQQVWSFHLKPAGFTGRMREDEAIPIVIGNTMYLASPYGDVIALDATTGAEKWRFQLPNNEMPSKRGDAVEIVAATMRNTPAMVRILIHSCGSSNASRKGAVARFVAI